MLMIASNLRYVSRRNNKWIQILVIASIVTLRGFHNYVRFTINKRSTLRYFLSKIIKLVDSR